MALLDSRQINSQSQGLIGHLNFYHPNWIQIFSRTEASYFPAMEPAAQEQALARLQDGGLACVIVSDGEQPPPAVRRFAESRAGARDRIAAAQPADHLGGAHLPRPRAGGVRHAPRCAAGRARNGRAAHRRERGRQERARARADHPRRRPGGGRRGRALSRRAGDPRKGAAPSC